MKKKCRNEFYFMGLKITCGTRNIVCDECLEKHRDEIKINNGYIDKKMAIGFDEVLIE